MEKKVPTKHCDKCQCAHPVDVKHWDFRPNAMGQKTPYRCKLNRRKEYAESVALAAALFKDEK